MSFKVAFLGFSDFERKALASYFRLALTRTPGYLQVATLTDADFLIADADHGPSVQLVVAIDRLDETVFVGAAAPAGSRAWMMRPMDALRILRELDAMVIARGAARSAAGEGSPQIAVIPPPRPTQVELAAALLTRPPAAARSAPAAAPTRALIVDDSDVARRYLELRLSRWRLDVEHAATSQQALSLLGERAYDLVFLDIELGDYSELDGLALCQRIKHSPQWMQAAVVMVSVHHSELDRVRGALAGCDGYLRKPLDEVDLQRLMLRQGLKLPKGAGATQT